jgi:PGF-CTERM protein
MKMKQVVALSALIILLSVAASPAVAAAPEVTVTVDGEDVSDGDTVEVEDSPAEVVFNVSSDVGVASVQWEHGTTLDAEGLRARETYDDSFSVPVFGQKDVTVEATDTNDDTRTVTVTLERSSGTAPGVREDLESLEERANRLENDTSELEQRRQELRERREELRQQRQQLENRTSDENGGTEGGNGSDGTDGADGGGQGMPGFTAVVALVAVSVAALSLRKRR